MFVSVILYRIASVTATANRSVMLSFIVVKIDR